MISTTCPVCRGEGRVVRKPCPQLRRERRRSRRRRRCRSPSRPASRTARRCGWWAAARRRRAAAAPATSTSSCASRTTSASSATAPTCTPRSRSAFRSSRWATRSSVPTLDGEARGRDSAGHAAGRDARAARAGHAAPRRRAGKGDVVAHLKLVVPTSLSRRGGSRTCAPTRRPAASASAPSGAASSSARRRSSPPPERSLRPLSFILSPLRGARTNGLSDPNAPLPLHLSLGWVRCFGAGVLGILRRQRIRPECGCDRTHQSRYVS